MASTAGPSASIIAPALTGVWIHGIADPGASELNYIYQDSARGESIDVQSAALSFVGRAYPVVEYGEHEGAVMALAVKVPWSDTHDAEVEGIRALKRSRATLCYRDNRGRLVFGVINGTLGISDVTDGTTVSFSFLRIDYTEGT